MKNATYYRKQAANVREHADKAIKDDIRARFLGIAAQFEALAEEADEAFKDALEKIAPKPKKADH
jgi:hypothetical protein